MDKRPILGLVLALVVVGAGLTVPPTVEADHVGGCPACIQLLRTRDVVVDSGGTATTTVGRAQEATQREISVYNFYNLSVVRVDFEVPWLDPPKDRRQIAWDPAISFAEGWTVEVDNTKGPNVPNRLTFYSTEDDYNIDTPAGTVDLDRANPLVFTIGFSVLGRPDPITLNPIQVDVTAHYEETSDLARTSTPEPLLMYLDARRPEVLPGGALTMDLRDGEEYGTANGRIDAMLVTFDEVMDQDSFNIDAFNIEGYVIRNAFFTDPSAPNGWAYIAVNQFLIDASTKLGNGQLKVDDGEEGNANLPVLDWDWYGRCPDVAEQEVDGCSQILFELEERLQYDTGALPELTGSSDGIRDLAGNGLANIRSTLEQVVDGAPPLLVSAFPHDADDPDDYEQVRMVFSEPVYWSNRTGSNPGGSTSRILLDRSVEYLEFPDDTSNNHQSVDFNTWSWVVDSELSGGRLIHPPCYRGDLGATCTYDDADDLRWVDIPLVTPINRSTQDAMEADPDGSPVFDRIRCRGIAPDGAGGVRDIGNGGNLYSNVAAAPFEDPEPDQPGLGMACRPGARCPSEASGANATSCPVRRLHMVEAQTDIWAQWAIVKFSHPVAAYDPDEPESEEALTRGSLDVITTNQGGPQGIVDIQHEPCSNFAVVRFDPRQKVLPTDVDTTPTHIRAVADRIKLCGTGFPAYERSADVKENEFDDPVILQESEVPLQDERPPRVVEARTIDENRNGIIDGYMVRWSEPVDDSEFCDQSIVCPGGETGRIRIEDAEEDASGPRGAEAKSYGPFYFDTAGVVDDDVMILEWDEAVDGDPRGPMHPDAFHTGLVPHLFIREATVQDMVPDTDPTGVIRPNPNADLNTPDAIRERDGASPVIWRAQTVDHESNLRTGEEDCKYGGPERCDPDPDGMLDGYRIRFSESVADAFGDRISQWASFDTRNWDVEGYDVIGIALENRVHDGFFDDTMYLRFSERPELQGDTDAMPDLTYALAHDDVTRSWTGLKDLAGNTMVNVTSIDVTEEDDARPAVWGIQGFEGADEITLVFSEPVDDGAGKSVVRPDLTYLNNNGVGVSGFAISDRAEPKETDPNEVRHEPGDRRAVVPLNGFLSGGDVSSDQIAALSNAIRETNPTVQDRKFVLPVPKPLDFAPDADPPCVIQDLSFDRVTANSVRLVWTAPDEDCVPEDPARGGTVASYNVRVANETFGQWDGLGSDNEGTQDFVITWPEPLAPPGATQTLTVSDLLPSTDKLDRTYHFHVVAVDEAGNVAGVVPNETGGQVLPATPVSAIMLKDTTPPEGDLQIESETHPEGQPTLERKATFTWSGLTDPESDVLYRWARNKVEDYNVVPGDTQEPSTALELDDMADGTWWLHVRGYSAGGFAEETAHYQIVVGADPIEEDALLDCDQQANDNLTVVRRGGLNRFSWELPSCADDLGTLVAVWVWRQDPPNGFYGTLKFIEGTYEDLRTWQDVDPDGDPARADSRYAIQLEFARGSDLDAEGQRYDQDPTPNVYEGKVPVNEDPGEVPGWIWILLGVALALIIAGLAIFFVLRGRDRAEAASTAAGYQWEELGGGASGVDEASGLPIHDIQCPSCATRFQALGETPLEVTCPNCRISGTLD